VSISAIFGVGTKSPYEIVSKTKRRQLNEVIGEFRSSQDCEPAEGKGVEESKGWSEEGYVVFVKEERLPYIDAVRQNPYVRYDARVEDSTDIGRRVTNAPQQEE
jgi:hypothetical protein